MAARTAGGAGLPGGPDGGPRRTPAMQVGLDALGAGTPGHAPGVGGRVEPGVGELRADGGRVVPVRAGAEPVDPPGGRAFQPPGHGAHGGVEDQAEGLGRTEAAPALWYDDSSVVLMVVTSLPGPYPLAPRRHAVDPTVDTRGPAVLGRRSGPSPPSSTPARAAGAGPPVTQVGAEATSSAMSTHSCVAMVTG